MADAAVLFLCLEGAALVTLIWYIWRRHRVWKVLRATGSQLRRSSEWIGIQRKTLLQQEAWRPGDPKTAFMREHLNRRIRTHNRIVDRVNEEATKL